MPFSIATFYKFTPLTELESLKVELMSMCRSRKLQGTILIALEGINATIAGKPGEMEAFLKELQSDPRIGELEIKTSESSSEPFHRMKVRIKKEIVTMKQDADPTAVVGTYVDPADWNALISDPQTIVIDTRNDFEVEMGTFENAINPKTEAFGEFPEYVDEHLDPEKHRKVALFCTGGIRCEKATSYMKSKGFEDVYHLKGGILKYIEEVSEDDSLWDGECFVFDGRVSVDHDLQPGSYALCYGCRQPISEEDRLSPLFEEGISCPKCAEILTDEQRIKFRERKRQIEIARSRGKVHIGEQP